jgi:hypothetical protein
VIQFLCFSCQVEQYPEAVHATDSDGEPPLHVACANDNASLQVIQYLVETCPESVQATDFNDWVALHFACSSKVPLQVLEYLVQAWPESIRATTSQFSGGELPLHSACRYKAPVEVVRLLVETWPEAVRATNAHGMTPTGVAVLQEVVSWLQHAEAMVAGQNV